MTLGVGQSCERRHASRRNRQKRNATKMSCDCSKQRRERECSDACRSAGRANALRTFAFKTDHQSDADGDGQIEPRRLDHASGGSELRL